MKAHFKLAMLGLAVFAVAVGVTESKAQSNNLIYIFNSPNFHIVAGLQVGSNNKIYATQVSGNNVFAINQIGKNNVAYIRQYGARGSEFVFQYGLHNVDTMVQIGNSNLILPIQP